MKSTSSYENHVKVLNHIIFKLISDLFNIFQHFGARDPAPEMWENIKIIWNLLNMM